MLEAGLLEVRGLRAWHGATPALHGVDLRVGVGECVALLGRNGAGRSTLLRALMGMVRAEGRARLHGRELLGRRPFEVARLGLGYVPESRDVFPTLTVRENLLMGEKPGRRSGHKPRWHMDELYALFPLLREREQAPAGVLSGGEQQMLALARTLMGDPDLLMADEPTEGLAPRMVEQVAALFAEVRRRGVAILLVEQKGAIALDLAARCLVMGRGQVVFEGTPAELRADLQVQRQWLAV